MTPEHPPAPSADALTIVDQVARSLARSRRLSTHDADDFVQSVHLRMAERGYRVLAEFEGRSSLRTYLTVVVQRLLIDWQNHEYGKWRPCKAAERLGDVGVQLDRLLNREGHTLEEAVGLLAGTTGTPEAALRAMAARVPRRARRRTVPLDALPDHLLPFVDPIADAERRRARAAVRAAVANVLRRLSHDDASLLRARFSGRLTVATVAEQRREDSRAVYRRLDRIKKTVRRQMLEVGVA
jgi:RNA polymerase sigma factor (sigma-70 family)